MIDSTDAHSTHFIREFGHNNSILINDISKNYTKTYANQTMQIAKLLIRK